MRVPMRTGITLSSLHFVQARSPRLACGFAFACIAGLLAGKGAGLCPKSSLKSFTALLQKQHRRPFHLLRSLGIWLTILSKDGNHMDAFRVYGLNSIRKTVLVPVTVNVKSFT